MAAAAEEERSFRSGEVYAGSNSFSEEAAKLRNTGSRGSTIVVAPWFLAPSDEVPTLSPSSALPFLRWSDSHPVAHTFRYGAESIPSGSGDGASDRATVSSFRAVDVLLETLCDRSRFPNLDTIVIAGHSAGGQFAQRYALTSDSWCLGDNDNASGSADLPRIRVVAANPRSYAYFDGRRFFPNSSEPSRSNNAPIWFTNNAHEQNIRTPFGALELRRPTAAETAGGCQSFNEYEWGLEDNPDLPAPYVTTNLNRLLSRDGDVSKLFCRYASRDVVYLSGERDVARLGDQHLGRDICREDGYQGPSRRERSERFFASLQVVGREVSESMHAMVPKMSGGFCGRDFDFDAKLVHRRFLARYIGHDHGLIFASDEGREAMFGMTGA